jgi:serine-type D-Ala-D-Ala carboxypeptidase (penicillin-binding protein 5/6)
VPVFLPRQGRLRATVAIALAILLLGVSGTAAGAAGPPRLDAGAWSLIDPRDETVLAAKASNKRLPIASATKLMTAYLALHELKPNQTITAPAYRARSPLEILLGLRQGERIKVKDLLYAAMLSSANDAANALAVGVSGSVPAFVNDMNRTAQRLGLTQTHYANPIGFDDPGNYSSANDLVTLASVLLRDRLFGRIVNTQARTLESGDRPRTVTSRNTLLGRAEWIDGVKTGHTLGADYVLVGSGTRDSTTLVSAVLGAPSESARDADTLELLDYGFSLYHPVEEVSRGEELASPKLDYRDEDLPLIAQRPLTVTVREGQRVSTRVSAPDEVSGAVEKGEPLGRVTVTVDGARAAVSPLVAAHAVGAATTVDKASSAAQNPIFLIALAAIVILVGVLLTIRGRRPRQADNPAPPQENQRSPRQRTPEERRRMHEERMRRRRERLEREGGTG